MSYRRLPVTLKLIGFPWVTEPEYRIFLQAYFFTRGLLHRRRWRIRAKFGDIWCRVSRTGHRAGPATPAARGPSQQAKVREEISERSRLVTSAATLGNDFGRAVSRILSSLLRAERIICLSSQYPGPVPRCGTCSGPLRGPLFGLAPDGVFRASALTLGAVGSYSTFSPLPRRSGAVCFLWHCPSASLSTCLPRVSLPAKAEKLRGIAPFGVRTFLPCPRFRAAEAILRPSKIAGNIARGSADARWRLKRQER